MATQPEAKLSKKIVLATRERGAWAEKIPGGPFKRGLPDIIGCYMGRCFGLEVKLPGRENTLTPLQKATLDSIGRAYGYTEMVTSVKQAMTVLDRIEDSGA